MERKRRKRRKRTFTDQVEDGVGLRVVLFERGAGAAVVVGVPAAVAVPLPARVLRPREQLGVVEIQPVRGGAEELPLQREHLRVGQPVHDRLVVAPEHRSSAKEPGHGEWGWVAG